MYYSVGAQCPLGMRVHVLGVSTVFLLVTSVTAICDTLPVDQIVAFGDSLTDTGNAHIASFGLLPGAGYAPTEYANPPAPGGPSGLWIDQFATKAGLPDPAPALAGGTNFAVAGAVTGTGFGEVDYQVCSFVTGTIAPACILPPGPTHVASTNLYTFWAGANDIRNGSSPITAANNLEANIASLAFDGGKYFLWFNLPLLGDTPAGQASGHPSALNAASVAFDTQWSADLATLKHEFPGIVLVDVDIATLLNQIEGDPAAYHITGLVEPKGDALNGYAFSFDGLHPTSYADQFIADLAWTDFEAAITPSTTTPEPTTAALLLMGAAVFAAARLKAKDRR